MNRRTWTCSPTSATNLRTCGGMRLVTNSLQTVPRALGADRIAEKHVRAASIRLLRRRPTCRSACRSPEEHIMRRGAQRSLRLKNTHTKRRGALISKVPEHAPIELTHIPTKTDPHDCELRVKIFATSSLASAALPIAQKPIDKDYIMTAVSPCKVQSSQLWTWTLPKPGLSIFNKCECVDLEMRG